MASLLHNHNAWIAACFAIYVALILLFAAIYYWLYRARPQRFLFAVGVQKTQLSGYRTNTLRRIQTLSAEIEALFQIQERAAKGAKPPDLASQGVQGVLESGCQFTLYMAQPAGSGSTKQPTIELRDPEGNELSRIPLATPWFGNRWDEASLRRTYKNESRIALLEKRLRSIETDPYDIWSYWDFLYFSAICQTTIGFGDILPNATSVRLLIVGQVLIGYGLLVVLLNVVFHP
jgi:hypothetical protein